MSPTESDSHSRIPEEMSRPADLSRPLARAARRRPGSDRAQGAERRQEPLLVPPVEGPLLDTLRPDQTGLDEHPHVLAHGRLTQPELLGDEQPAHAVFDQIAVHLRTEVPGRLLQPAED